MPNHSVQLTSLFQALGDPTRLAVLERLSHGPASTSELAGAFSMALPSFTQHLSVLEKNGLVKSRKSGRVRTYHLAPEQLAVAEGWMVRQRRMWERRLDQLDELLQELKETEQ